VLLASPVILAEAVPAERASNAAASRMECLFVRKVIAILH
jgi:hypothetical protein